MWGGDGLKRAYTKLTLPGEDDVRTGSDPEVQAKVQPSALPPPTGGRVVIDELVANMEGNSNAPVSQASFKKLSSTVGELSTKIDLLLLKMDQLVAAPAAMAPADVDVMTDAVADMVAA